jgi:hypothetical protein
MSSYLTIVKMLVLIPKEIKIGVSNLCQLIMIYESVTR